jgi:hypothetical protein
MLDDDGDSDMVAQASISQSTKTFTSFFVDYQLTQLTAHSRESFASSVFYSGPARCCILRQ